MLRLGLLYQQAALGYQMRVLEMLGVLRILTKDVVGEHQTTVQLLGLLVTVHHLQLQPQFHQLQPQHVRQIVLLAEHSV